MINHPPCLLKGYAFNMKNRVLQMKRNEDELLDTFFDTVNWRNTLHGIRKNLIYK